MLRDEALAHEAALHIDKADGDRVDLAGGDGGFQGVKGEIGGYG